MSAASSSESSPPDQKRSRTNGNARLGRPPGVRGARNKQNARQRSPSTPTLNRKEMRTEVFNTMSLPQLLRELGVEEHEIKKLPSRKKRESQALNRSSNTYADSLRCFKKLFRALLDKYVPKSADGMFEDLGLAKPKSATTPAETANYYAVTALKAMNSSRKNSIEKRAIRAVLVKGLQAEQRDAIGFPKSKALVAKAYHDYQSMIVGQELTKTFHQ